MFRAGAWSGGIARGAARACLFLRLHRGREHDRTALAWITHRNISCRLNARLARRDAHERDAIGQWRDATGTEANRSLLAAGA